MPGKVLRLAFRGLSWLASHPIVLARSFDADAVVHGSAGQGSGKQAPHSAQGILACLLGVYACCLFSVTGLARLVQFWLRLFSEARVLTLTPRKVYRLVFRCARWLAARSMMMLLLL